MDRCEGLQQQIWEFVYDLASEDDAAELRRQIRSDPAVARLYAEIKLQAELLAEAARLDAPPIRLKPPQPASPLAVPLSETTPSGADIVPPAELPPARGRLFPALAAIMSLAASLLVGFVGWSYLKPQSPLRPVAFQTQREALSEMPVRTALLGPSRLQPRPANHLAIVTQSPDGQPRAAQVMYRLYGEGDRLLLEGRRETSGDGTLQIQTPDELPGQLVRLEVEPAGSPALPPLTYMFKVEADELSTHVNLDKPLCRPGQTLRYRTVTLSRYDLQVRQEVEVQVEIRGPDDQVLAASQRQGLTERGVFHGEFVLPEAAAAGSYQLLVRSPSARFADASRSFQVRQFASPRLRTRLTFGRESFAPGDEVHAMFSAQRPEGGQLANAPLQVQAEVDGQIVLETAATTDARGRYDVNFALPERLQRGEGLLKITVLGDPAESVVRPLPIHQGEVELAFFPESGDLVAGVENRVYFRARDPQGQPVHVAGLVLDQAGRQLAAVRTERDGRGVFSLIPRPGELYRLQVQTPPGVPRAAPLPPPNPARFVVLDTGPGVFAPAAPLALEVRSTRPERTLAVTATCRGAVVGQRIITPDQFHINDSAAGSRNLEIPLAERAEGVIRVTASDLTEQPARPLAERLVFRQPRQRLNVQIEHLQSEYSPQDELELALQVRNEAGQPVPATLGIAVVDDALLSLADDHAARLTTHFFLTGDLRDARGLEDANFYLQANDPEAQAALDLLLGTQGWRRLAAAVESSLAFREKSSERVGQDGLPATRSIASQEPAVLQVLAENTSAVQAAVRQAAAGLRTARQVDLRRSGLILLTGSLIVLTATLLLILLLRADGLRRLLPPLAAAAICSIIGILWISAEVGPQGQVAWLRPPSKPALESRADDRPVTPPSQEQSPPEPAAPPASTPAAELEKGMPAPAPAAAERLKAAHEFFYEPAERQEWHGAASNGSADPEGSAAGQAAMTQGRSRQLDGAASQQATTSSSAADDSLPTFGATVPAGPEQQDELAAAAAENLLGRAAKKAQAASDEEAEEIGAISRASRHDSGQAVDSAQLADDSLRRQAGSQTLGDAMRQPSEPPPAVGGGMGQGRADFAGARPQAQPPAPPGETAVPEAPAAAPLPAPAAPAAPAIELALSAAPPPAGAEADSDDREARSRPAAEVVPPQQPPMARSQADLQQQGAIGDGLRAGALADQPALGPSGGATDQKRGTPAAAARQLGEIAAGTEFRGVAPGGGMGGGMGGAPAAGLPASQAASRKLESESRWIVRDYALWDLDPSAAVAHTRDATQYWAPLVIADREGRARCEFRLPDTEATFRLSIDAHAEGRIGSQEASITSRRAEP